MAAHNSGMIKQPLEEWKAEATERFGPLGRNWKFVCPRCGNVQCAQDFANIGVDQTELVNLAFQNCIGRYTKEKGCDWAAYGLFGTMGKGRKIIAPDDGREVEVFDFAPADPSAEPTESSEEPSDDENTNRTDLDSRE